MRMHYNDKLASVFYTTSSLFLLLVAVTVFAACAGSGETSATNNTKQLTLALASLEWVDGADAIGDANKAIQAGNYILYQNGNRGGGVIGLSKQQQDQLNDRCALKILPGDTDTILDTAHLAKLQDATAYAKTYNITMLDHCITHQ